jgi:hypothetical protein
MVDLDPDNDPCTYFYNPVDFYNGSNLKPASWAWCYVNGVPRANTDLHKSLTENKMDIERDYYGLIKNGFYWHPGFGWAYRREALEALGGLIDYSILGAADMLMAACLTGDISLSDWLADSYKRWIFEWKARADRYIRGDIGYVSGLLLHYWHGKKSQRGYKDRWKIFFDHKFDPELDLKRDCQGLWQLTDRNSALRDALRAYLKARNEDSIDP